MDINGLVTQELQKQVNTNTFSGGMDSDTSDSLLQDNKYREAYNVRYITDKDSNNGELHLIEGALKITNTPGDVVLNQNFPKSAILASTTIRDYGIIIAKGFPEDDGSYTWSIFRYKKGNESEEYIGKYKRIFGSCSEPLWDQNHNNYKLSLVTRWESDDNIKLYIADGHHKLMSINIVEDIFFQNQGLEWGPKYNIEEITGVIDVPLLTPVIEKEIAGRLLPGIVQYAYRLYTPYGQFTRMSTISTPYYVYKKQGINSKGFPLQKRTDIGLKLNIDLFIPLDSPVRFLENACIQVYRISYLQNGQLPQVDLIIDEPLNTKTKKVITDTGIDPLSTLTPGEFNTLSGIDILPTCIESKNDYLFAGNIKYPQDSFASDWDARTYSYRRNTSLRQPDDYNNDILDVNNPYTIMSSDVYSKYIYKKDSTVIGGTGENIEWEFIVDNTDVIDKDIEAEYTEPDDKIGQHLSLRRGEVYRYGIVLYSYKGLKSDVHFIQDIRVPYNFTDSSNKDDLFYVSGTEIKSRRIGIRFSVKNLPKDCYGYEIVRCNRTIDDSSIIAQGVISYPMETEIEKAYYHGLTQSPAIFTGYSHQGGMQIDDNQVFATIDVHSTNRLMQFISPEVSYQQDDILDLINANSCFIECRYAYNPSNHYISNKALLYKYSFDGFVGYDNIVPNQENKSITVTSSTVGGNFLYHTNVDTQKVYFNSGGHYTKQITEDYFPYSRSTQYGGVRLTYNQDLFYNTRPITDDDYHYNDDYGYFKFNQSQAVPYSTYLNNTQDTKRNITNCVKANVSNWDDIADADGNEKITDNVSFLGEDYYINWTLGSFLTKNSSGNKLGLDALKESGKYNNNGQKGQLIGPGGKSILLKLDNPNWLYISAHWNGSNSPTSILQDYFYNLGVIVCNIKKQTTPYGGFSEQAVKNSTFYGHGQYFTAQGHHIGEDPTGQQDEYSDVFDGDVFIQCYEHVHVHKWDNPILKYGTSFSVIYSIPLETSINIIADHGCKFSKLVKASVKSKSYIQVRPAQIENKKIAYSQSDPMYQYNTAYSISPSIQQNYIIDPLDRSKNNYDYRIHYSNQKLNNERIDSWAVFQSANYIDVDTRYGELSGLRLFKNTLVFWQENATGMLSVNERQLLQNVDNTTLMLGTGDILQRYDYLTTEYGMKSGDYSDTQSDNALYWIDRDRKEMLRYSIGSQIQPLVKSKNIRNYINTHITPLQNPIKIVYDSKYSEILNNGYLPVFSELTDCFTGIYRLPFTHYLSFNDRLLFINDYLYKWNTSNGEVSTTTYHKPWTPANDPIPIPLYPSVKYVVNNEAHMNKVFDLCQFGGRFYGGGEITTSGVVNNHTNNNNALKPLLFKFTTPLKQEAHISGSEITNREYDFRFAIPRAGYEDPDTEEWITGKYGDRLRGKTMQCEFSSNSNSLDFSLQYITTKYRISWS